MDNKRDEKNIVRILKAIASENRFLILKCLHKNKELSVGDLAEMTDLPFRSASKDLGILRRAGLVWFRNYNLTRRYSINKNNFPKELLYLFSEHSTF